MRTFLTTFGVIVITLIVLVLMYFGLMTNLEYQDKCGGLPWTEFAYKYNVFIYTFTGKC